MARTLPLDCPPSLAQAAGWENSSSPVLWTCWHLVQVLEILNDNEVRVLSEDRQPMSYSQRVQAKAEEADLRQAQQQQWPDAKEDPRVA